MEALPESATDPAVSAVESVTTEEVATEEAGALKVSEPETTASPEKIQAESTVDGEHTCSECGMSFQRRYSLIMHTLKHEKARGYKCSVSVGACHCVVLNC